MAAQTQVEEAHLVGEGVQGIHILLDAKTFLGELLLKVAGERLAAARNAVPPSVLVTIELVHAVCVDGSDVNPVADAEIAADPVEGAAGLEAAHHVHARVECHAVSRERLQTAARAYTPFQDGYLVPLLGQKRTREESADAAADNDHILVHCLISKAQRYDIF